SVDVYSTKDAKSAEIRTRLPNAAYFVYVGHAHYSSDATVKRPTALPSAPSPAPPDPWPPQAGGATSQPSYLPLDDHGAQLRVADVSTSTPAPRVVVLLGCGTGTLEAGKRQGGQSLATAFLGAGADVAIASTRTVEAREAIALGRGLRHHLSSQSAADPGRWVQQAMQWARDERPGQDQDWSTESIADFRVFVR
ncbi:MAG: CHAT domain-containing protein, partial [Myxococcales bacterium]|nr:CHAT domain-containing protein [Myxococcales bacterium]